MSTAADLRVPEAEPRSAAGAISARSRLVQVVERNAFIVAVLGVGAAILAAIARTEVGPDAWYSLVSGRLIAHDGLPGHDTLTAMTLGRTWVDQEWLGHLGIYGLFAAGGWPGILLTDVLLFTGAFAILAAGARLNGASERSVALIAAAAFVVGAPNTAVRAQIAAYVLFALVVVLLLGDERRPSRRVYLTFPILIVWANTHGSVLIGAALVSIGGLCGAIASLRRPGHAGGGILRAATLIIGPWLCVLASPYALELPGYYRHILGDPAIRQNISEWAAGSPGGQPFFFALLVAAAVLAAVGAMRHAVTPLGLIAIVATGVLGVAAIRNQVWFALVAAVTLPGALDSVWRPSPARRRRRVNLALAAGSIGFAVFVLAWVGGSASGWIANEFPAPAATAVSAAARSTPDARIFADEQYADWLLFKDPTLAGRIAYDVRYELLPNAQLRRIVAFRHERGTDWQAVAAPYDLLVLDPGADARAITWFERRGSRVVSRGHGPVVLSRAG